MLHYSLFFEYFFSFEIIIPIVYFKILFSKCIKYSELKTFFVNADVVAIFVVILGIAPFEAAADSVDRVCLDPAHADELPDPLSGLFGEKGAVVFAVNLGFHTLLVCLVEGVYDHAVLAHINDSLQRLLLEDEVSVEVDDVAFGVLLVDLLHSYQQRPLVVVLLEGAVVDAVHVLIQRVDVPLQLFSVGPRHHLDRPVVHFFDDADGTLDEALASDAHHHFALALFVTRFTQTLLHAFRQPSAEHHVRVLSRRHQIVRLEDLD